MATLAGLAGSAALFGVQATFPVSHSATLPPASYGHATILALLAIALFPVPRLAVYGMSVAAAGAPLVAFAISTLSPTECLCTLRTIEKTVITLTWVAHHAFVAGTRLALNAYVFFGDLVSWAFQ